MSRIIKYQDSIRKFIKNRSSVINFDIEFKQFIEAEILNSEYLIPIILLTIMNSQNRKNKNSLNGYHMASGIEFLYILNRIISNDKYYIKKIGQIKYNKYINNIIMCIYSSLSNNIDSINSSIKDKAVCINSTANKYLNSKLMILINKDTVVLRPENKKNDLDKYQFKNHPVRDNVIQVDKTYIIENMDKSISNVCRIGIVLGWILGCGDMKHIEPLEKLGQCLGILIKISNDCDKIENDSDTYINIDNNEETVYSNNYVLNYGIQNSFELFVDTKQKFIEIALKFDIYTNSIKDIIDNLEKKLDIVLNKTNPDLQSIGSC